METITILTEQTVATSAPPTIDIFPISPMIHHQRKVAVHSHPKRRKAMTRILIVMFVGAFICSANFGANLRPYLEGKILNYYIQATLLMVWAMAMILVLLPESQMLQFLVMKFSGR